MIRGIAERSGLTTWNSWAEDYRIGGAENFIEEDMEIENLINVPLDLLLERKVVHGIIHVLERSEIEIDFILVVVLRDHLLGLSKIGISQSMLIMELVDRIEKKGRRNNTTLLR